MTPEELREAANIVSGWVGDVQKVLKLQEALKQITPAVMDLAKTEHAILRAKEALRELTSAADQADARAKSAEARQVAAEQAWKDIKTKVSEIKG